MSFRTIQQNTVERTATLSVPPAVAARGVGTGWIRNPTWPALPSIVATDNKIVGLYAVNPDSAFAAVVMNTSAGTYTVDWGDGSTPQTYTSGAQANYTYNYAAAGLVGTDGPVTFTDAGDLVTRTAHGYIDNQQVSFASITTTTGIVANQIYYVVNATTDTFQVAATIGGSALALTGDGTGTLLPYKIATITITPTTGGATFTTVNFAARNSSTTIAYTTGWLDLAVAASATTLTFFSILTPVLHANLEQVRILRHRATTLVFQGCARLANIVEITADTGIALTSCNGMFNACRSLITVPLFNTANVTDFSSMFNECSSLISVPFFNTQSATAMGTMFGNCSSLTMVPLFNTANVTSMISMFTDCYSLQSVPLFNTAACTNMSSMFNNCSSLISVPLFNTAACTNMGFMFNACRNLASLPLFNTQNVTSMQFAFSTCRALLSVPLFNTQNVTTMQLAFNACTTLQTVPLLNTATCTNMNGAFSGCVSLTSLPAFNTSAVTDMTNVVSGCTSLSAIPAFDCSRVQQATVMGFGTTLSNCRRISATGIYYSFSVASQLLSGTALDEIYTNLPTVAAQGTAVTFTDVGDTVTLASHGLTEGRTVRFTTIVTTTGIAINTTYFVRNPTANTFQLSTTATGAIINLVNNGTGTLTGQTITVTSNWGITTDTPSIATAKGWVVTGS